MIDKAFIKLSLALESPWCLRYRDIKTCRAVGEKSHAGSVCSLAIGPLQGWTSGLPLLFHRLYPEERSVQGQEHGSAAMSQLSQVPQLMKQ